MRLMLDLAEDGSSVQVRVDRYGPQIPADQLADAVYRVVLAALEERTTLGIPTADPEDPDATELDEPVPFVPAPRPAVDQVDPDAQRREVLRLLDEEQLTADQVCVRLGISRALLRRWDDDAHVDTSAVAGA